MIYFIIHLLTYYSASAVPELASDLPDAAAGGYIMRKIFTTLPFVFILFGLIGCSANDELTSLQKQFIKDVEKSLEEKDKWL